MACKIRSPKYLGQTGNPKNIIGISWEYKKTLVGFLSYSYNFLGITFWGFPFLLLLHSSYSTAFRQAGPNMPFYDSV